MKMPCLAARARLGCCLTAVAMLAGHAAPAAAQIAPPRSDIYYERWAEVVSVTPRWLVLRDAQGKEYPVSVDAIGLFITRWPTTIDRISPTALVEATGVDMTSGRLMTDHLDIYEGGARNLVRPGLVTIFGNGRAWRPIDFTFNSDVYGAPFPGFDVPIQGGAYTGPPRMHIVGPLVNRVPAVIASPDNITVTIVPAATGVSLSQITPGSVNDVRPGDLVYFAAIDFRAKSLVLEQLVVYKSMPIDQFVR